MELSLLVAERLGYAQNFEHFGAVMKEAMDLVASIPEDILGF